VLSVTGRLATIAAQRRVPAATVVAAVFALQAAGAAGAAGAAALPLPAGATAGAVGCVLAFGLGFGVATIARPVLLADRYGTEGFATLSGLLATPLTLAEALAPLGAAALRSVTGSPTRRSSPAVRSHASWPRRASTPSATFRRASPVRVAAPAPGQRVSSRGMARA